MGRLRIFLCYRRDDTRWVAGRLYDELHDRYEVFQDVTAIRPGIKYTDQIQEEISRCDVLVVVIGESWLSAADSKGRRRLDSPRDLVRLEITAALQRGIPIIPVLVQRASMPADVELPDDIADFSFYHACEVTDTRWDYDVGVLLKAIDDFAGPSVPDETSPGGSQAVTVLRQKGRGGKGEHYRAFWTRFLERVQAEHPGWTTARIPQKDNWITMPSGIKGAVYGCNFAAGGRLRSELYIDGGDAEANLALFRALRTRTAAVEAAYGKELTWEELPTRRACRIADYTNGDVTNTDQHDAYIDWFFDTTIRLRRALPGPADQGLDSDSNLAAVPRAIQVFRHGRSDVTGVAFSPDGRLLVTGSNDKTARVWEVATGQKRVRVTHEDRVWGVAFSPDGWLVATAYGHRARVWEVATGQKRATAIHTYEILGVAFSPDGRLLATGSADGTARLWEVPGGQRRARLTHGDSVWGVAFSPDGRLLATAGGDGTARVWEVATGQKRIRVTHGDYAVRGVAFSPDGRLLATAGGDGTARVWDVASGQERARVTHNDQVVGVAFSPDGRLLATASHDDTARVWELFTLQ